MIEKEPSPYALAKEINGYVRKGDEAQKEADEFYAAAGRKLAQLKKRKPVNMTWDAALVTYGVQLKRSRADELIRVFEQRITSERIRENNNARKREHRKKDPPFRNGGYVPNNTTPTNGTKIIGAWNLYNRPGYPGGKQAAAEALRRMGIDPETGKPMKKKNKCAAAKMADQRKTEDPDDIAEPGDTKEVTASRLFDWCVEEALRLAEKDFTDVKITPARHCAARNVANAWSRVANELETKCLRK